MQILNHLCQDLQGFESGQELCIPDSDSGFCFRTVIELIRTLNFVSPDVSVFLHNFLITSFPSKSV